MPSFVPTKKCLPRCGFRLSTGTLIQPSIIGAQPLTPHKQTNENNKYNRTIQKLFREVKFCPNYKKCLARCGLHLFPSVAHPAKITLVTKNNLHNRGQKILSNFCQKIKEFYRNINVYLYKLKEFDALINRNASNSNWFQIHISASTIN